MIESLTNLLSWLAVGFVGSKAIIFPLPLLGAGWYRDILCHDFRTIISPQITHNFLYSKHIHTFNFLHFKGSKDIHLRVTIFAADSHDFEVHLQKKIVSSYLKGENAIFSRTRHVII